MYVIIFKIYILCICGRYSNVFFNGTKHGEIHDIGYLLHAETLPDALVSCVGKLLTKD